MGTLLLFILVFLVLSAFFSGSEIAYLSANKLGIELLKEKKDWTGRILTNFYEKPTDFLGTMLVGNNIALVVFTTLMTRLLGSVLLPQLEAGPGRLIIETLLITVVVLIFGEFLPKTIFRIFADRMMKILALPLQFFKVLLAIPTWVMTSLSGLVLRIFFKNKSDDMPYRFSRVDLEHYVQDNFQGSEEEEVDTEIFRNALQLKETKVRDCMVPRNEVVAIDQNEEMKEVVRIFDESKLSRILAYQGDIDNVTGYIHHHQMLQQPQSLKKVLSQIPYVPEVMNVHDLMNAFIKEGKNIACVVDEFGGTSGVITLEDILEEIFGEIEDEHDVEDHIEEQLGAKEWKLSGRLEINYLNEKYEGLNLPEGEYNTLSGYLVMTTANIPEEGEEITLGEYRFLLEKVSSTRIETVKVYGPLDAD
ncbi:MAG: hemolysin family protein [Saprospiraceae bacterium]|nr:hemolysin family protein [Saprospiraceae bacterium]